MSSSPSRHSIRLSTLRALAAASVLLLTAGLFATGCEETFEGPPELVPARLDNDGHLSPLKDGDDVELMRPIQGGHVLYVGALIRNASSHGSVLGELRRSQAQGMPLTQPGGILVFDERTADAEPLPTDTPPPSSAAGWKQLRADPSNLANVPACPNFLDLDLVDAPLFLQVRYRDSAGREAVAARKVWLRCNQPDSYSQNQCRCECLANYTIERCLERPDLGS